VFTLSLLRSNNTSSNVIPNGWAQEEPNNSKIGFRKVSTEPKSVNSSHGGVELDDLEAGHSHIKITRGYETRVESRTFQ
jgi:hypothetical protein